MSCRLEISDHLPFILQDLAVPGLNSCIELSPADGILYPPDDHAEIYFLAL